ncbi:ATP-binding cassette domain-containing protein [Pseudoalteromonas sp. MMG022]|uniref:ATP-binding cassette domain-containing protein n=1 Tax=Pseudoalteromonas sp. MMG022 TaxID=2909978 RepID=UPI001F0295B0|nr:ATP-binding cassette domain-containing protein [Pseudoalteromonas sp. MMG022]MCF6436943.1 ATP-binding cassette domain-containing protein [Pseudoalteromonas sp. MMG022]
MPVLTAQNLSYQFADGNVIFNALNCAIDHTRIGLVGKNGAGKSILARLLAKQLAPTQGRIHSQASIGFFDQHAKQHLDSSTTIAQFLGHDSTLKALEKIANGHCEPALFDAVEQHWQLPQTLSQQLIAIGLPNDYHMLCKHLSGGQLARLRLWQLFDSNAELLILDEPSNHLDADGRQWLAEQLSAFRGHVLLVSHDHTLLKQVSQIWELSELGLKQYGTDFDNFLIQKHTEQSTQSKQINAVRKQQLVVKRQAQLNKEKAQKRAAQGNKLRASNSQAKVLLNSKRDNATANASSNLKNQQQRQKKLQDKHAQLRLKQQQHQTQQLYLGNISKTDTNKRSLVSAQQLTLPFGQQKALNFTIYQQQKWHIQGANGSGKSTLLKVLLDQRAPKSGSVIINTTLSYIDQHFLHLTSHQNCLDTLTQTCPELTHSVARTLLAGIGLKKTKVSQPINTLSGGEKMKLSMLCASQQSPTPLLLLDEPDNHLDFDSKQQLAKALSEYSGSFLIVSHDEYFLTNIGITHELSLNSE